MQDFYLEQALVAPMTPAMERSLLRRLASCANSHRAQWRDCLLDDERHRLVCRIAAADLPTARAAAQCSGFGADATWLSAMPGTTMASDRDAREGLVDVLAECRWEPPVAARDTAHGQQTCGWCLDALRVEPGPVITCADGRRILALFRAPDAEAVRNACRRARLPFERVVALRRIGNPLPTAT
jgi:hypothetical protein